MKPWSDMEALVLPYVPGCAEILAHARLRQAAIEFCTDTLAVQRTLDPTLSLADAAEYDFDIGAHETVARLLACSIGGTPLCIARPADFDHARALTGSPRYAYSVDGTRTFVVAPAPAADDLPIVTRVALRPSQTAEGLDDAVFDMYAAAIADGAIAALCLMPGKAFTNPALAVASRATFRDAINTAKVRAFHAHARSTPRVRGTYF